MGRKRSAPLNELFTWVRRQSTKVKIFIAAACVFVTLVGLKLLVRDRNHFYVASEAIHFAGILVLIYKLTTQKTCSGLSLKTQDLTAVFLASRLSCSFWIEGNIHTFLDTLTLGSTLWVIYMIRFKLKSTYISELDNMPLYYVASPSALIALLVNPYTSHPKIIRMVWAFSVYLESVCVFPQLRMMQNTKMIEPFTAHYVFALGIARLLACANWIIRVYDSGGHFLYIVGSGYMWPPFLILSEIVQTFILADFCYYYMKSVMHGRLLDSLSRV